MRRGCGVGRQRWVWDVMMPTADEFQPTKVPPVPEGTPRPFWSVMVPTYNREQFLSQTLQSILEQDQGPDRMQLCVVDNATTTFDVRAMLQRLAGDRIEYVRHPVNIGGIRNINSCIIQSRGQWIHVLHDDDLVMPGFYRAYENAIARYPEAALLFCPTLDIDDRGVAFGLRTFRPAPEGRVSDFLVGQATGNRVPTPSVVVPRHVYEKIGAYCETLSFVPDWEFGFRAGMCGEVVTLSLPYVAARWHERSDTVKLIKSTVQVVESKRIVDELVDRLSPEQRATIGDGKYATIAQVCEAYAHNLARWGERKAQIEQLTWAFKLRPTRARLIALFRARAVRMIRFMQRRR
jgi:glycosyltransferase involved in cell wall biosynthesis